MTPLSVAYMPLVDAAPVILAEELGFAEGEGLRLDLKPAPSWSSVRDMLAFGRAEAAHLLSPVPVAMAMGLGGVSTPVSAVSVLSVNGNTIGVNRDIASRLRAAGHDFAFDDPVAVAKALSATCTELTIGVPFPFSMHALLLRYWIEGTALADLSINIRTVPPPMMAAALASGAIDGFCVGEPWGSVAVEAGLAALLLPGRAIWQHAPEKVLTVRTDWAEAEPDLTGRLMRAVWRAGAWLSQPESATTAAQILSRKTYLDLPTEVIERALTGQMVVTPEGDQRHVEGFLGFHSHLASFPWRSQAKWIAHRLHLTSAPDTPANLDSWAEVYRSDIYRQALAGVAEMPGNSEKLEGAIRHAQHVDTDRGEEVILPDGFFDRRIFDPSA